MGARDLIGAEQAFDDALYVCTKRYGPNAHQSAPAYAFLAELCLKKGDVSGALEHTAKGLALAKNDKHVERLSKLRDQATAAGSV